MTVDVINDCIRILNVVKYLRFLQSKHFLCSITCARHLYRKDICIAKHVVKNVRQPLFSAIPRIWQCGQLFELFNQR